MKILLDLGNSRLKAALLHSTPQGLQLTHPFAVAYEHHHSWTHWLQHILPNDSQTPIEAIGISVATDNQRLHVENSLRSFHCPIHWLDARTPNPLIHNAYEQPAQLGADRWFGALGAFYQFKPHPHQALIYCSLGTATTIDTLLPTSAVPQLPTPPSSKPWTYLGGLILPGPFLMYQSLDQHTARLRSEQGKVQDFPTNTRSAISSGIAAAQIGALAQQIRQAQQYCPNHPVRVVCSGGGWPLIAAAIERLITQWPHLYTGPQPQLHYYEYAVLLGLGSATMPVSTDDTPPPALTR